MSHNSLYPSFIKLFYTSNTHNHLMTIPVDAYLGVGGVYGLNYPVPGPGAFPWTDGVDGFVNVFKAFFKTSDSINRAELWTMATPTADPIYRAAHEIAVAGTQTGATSAFGQSVTTFRTNTGGILRVYAMEPVLPVNVEAFPPTYGSTVVRAVNDFITGASSWFRGRDGGYPVVGIRYLSKTNDALRKKYQLDA